MKIHTSVSEIDLNQWQQLINDSPTASFFQTPECYHFYKSLSFFKPFVIGVSENDKLVGIIVGYIVSDGNFIKRYFSRRAIVPGGALLHSRISTSSLNLLLKSTIDKLRSKAIYLEFRNYNDYSQYRKTFEATGFKYAAHLNFHISTPDIEIVTSQLNTTKRRDIKVSRKEGTQWYETKDKQDILEFYEILSDLYKNKIKTPLFPIEFFKKINLLPNAKLLVVKYNGKVIGGSQCVLLPDQTLYEWFVCGLDARFKKNYPSTVATWAAIEYAVTYGLKKFDMMGAGKPDEDYGVREFKSKFGGDLLEFGRFQIVLKPLLYQIGKFGINYIRYGIKILKGTNLKKEINPVIVKNDTNTIQLKIESDVTNINIKDWSDFVLNHPNGNIFQSPEMYEVNAKTNKLTPLILVAINSDNKIVGCLSAVIQREFEDFTRVFTARSVVMGGPLSQNNDPFIAEVLIQNYNKIVKRKAIYTQFRNMTDMSGFSNSFFKNKYTFNEHLDIVLDLGQTKEQLYQNLHKERRRNIAQAEKEGLTFMQLIDDKDIESVISLIKKTYTRVRVPFSMEMLFKNARNLMGNEIVFFGTFYENKMIAGQIRLFYKDLAYAWYAGSDSDYFNKRPNDFLMWNVILWSKEKNHKIFDFGGAGTPNVPYGVRDYKLKFGGELVNYGRYEIVHKKILMIIGENAYKLWKKFKK